MKNFKEVVLDMKLSDIILSMVNGIEKQWVKLDMGTFGGRVYEICFGCAATNTICEIVQKSFPPDKIVYRKDRVSWLGTDIEFLRLFESFVDSLRRSDNYSINFWYSLIYFKPLPQIFNDFKLPCLTNSSTTKKNLNFYRKAAMVLKENNL